MIADYQFGKNRPDPSTNGWQFTAGTKNPVDSEQQPKQTMITGSATNLALAALCLSLFSCATKNNEPPPQGAAIIDAMPDPEHPHRIEDIQLVSVNGKGVHGTRSVIQPGLNTVKTRFRWPQGKEGEVDLRFYATPGTVYNINFDEYPPTSEFEDGVAGKMMNAVGSSSDPYAGLGAAFIAPVAAVVGTGERLAHYKATHRQAITHIDLSVTAHHSGQGIVRQVRAYPDGRVDEKPWAAWAQMKAP